MMKEGTYLDPAQAKLARSNEKLHKQENGVFQIGAQVPVSYLFKKQNGFLIYLIFFITLLARGSNRRIRAQAKVVHT